MRLTKTRGLETHLRSVLSQAFRLGWEVSSAMWIHKQELRKGDEWIHHPWDWKSIL